MPDLVFRVGPITLFAISGSNDVGDRNLRFREPNVFESKFIGGNRNLVFSDGRFTLQPTQQATNLSPSGKGWDYPLEGQGFTSGSTNQLFPKLKRT